LPAGADNHLIEITEANIGTYGGTWADVVAWGNVHATEPGYRSSFRWYYGAETQMFPTTIHQLPTDGSLEGYTPPLSLGAFTVEQLTFNFYASNFTGTKRVMDWVVRGDGIIAPEPSSVVLLACSAVWMFGWRHKGHSRGSSRSSRS
jgi:hypothetical protein